MVREGGHSFVDFVETFMIVFLPAAQSVSLESSNDVDMPLSSSSSSPPPPTPISAFDPDFIVPSFAP